jgi:hypothetical protein
MPLTLYFHDLRDACEYVRQGAPTRMIFSASSSKSSLRRAGTGGSVRSFPTKEEPPSERIVCSCVDQLSVQHLPESWNYRETEKSVVGVGCA